MRSSTGAGTPLQKIASREVPKPQSEVAPETDHQVESARRAVVEADHLRQEWKESSLRQAIDKYQMAWRIFEDTGQRVDAANTLLQLGELYSVLGEYRQALIHFEQALNSSRATRNVQREIDALNSMGDVHTLVGENEKAIAMFRLALRLGRNVDYKRGVARAMGNLGVAFYNLSDMNAALDFLTQALPLCDSVQDPQGRAQILRYLGYLHTDMSELSPALDYFQQSLPLWRAVRDLRGEAQTVNALGLIHSLLGEKEQAISYYNQAEQIFRNVGDKKGIITALNGQGEVFADLNLVRALDSHSEALRLSQETGELEGQIISRRYLGNTHRALGDSGDTTQGRPVEWHYEQAIQHYEQALLLCRILKDRRIEAYNLQDLGGIYDFLGDTKKALAHYSRALQLTKEVKDPRGEALVLNHVGVIYAKSNRRQQALSCFEKALPLTRLSQDRARESLTLYNLAHLRRDEGKLAAASENIESAVSIVESLRSRVPGHKLRSFYFASVHKYHELRIDLLMQRHKQQPGAGYDVKALEDSDLAHARSLLDMLAEARAEILRAVPQELLREERRVRQTLNLKAEHQMNLLSGPHTEVQAAAAAKEIRDLTAKYENIEGQLTSQNPHYAALTRPRGLSLREIQDQVIDDQSLLLEYSLGEERSYVWAVTRSEVEGFELPGRSVIEEAARRFYNLLIANQPQPGETFEQQKLRSETAERQLPHEAAALGRLILGPVATKLKNQRLIIVADGALQYIPFQALVAPATGKTDYQKGGSNAGTEAAGQPLILNHEIVNQPSASALARLIEETAGRKVASNSVAILADPVFESDDPRVQPTGQQDTQASAQTDETHAAVRDLAGPGGLRKITRLLASRTEADAIMGVAPWGTGMKATDFNASRDTATSPQLNSYRIVHFATHGFLDNDHPELSGIVLSLVDQQGRPQNGFLRLHDIYNLDLPVDLVVLSACNTALGKDVRGEGLVGLTRGFMYAGAAGVVASLWKVDDEATAELMRHFYSGMFGDGLSPAAALRKAQLELAREKRWHSPYYWAGFVIQGQYAERQKWEPATSWRAKLIVAGTVIILFLIAGFYGLRHRRRTTF
jgi:CHAT domain-containing protein/Tfp pilus assembly protein PilF